MKKRIKIIVLSGLILVTVVFIVSRIEKTDENMGRALCMGFLIKSFRGKPITNAPHSFIAITNRPPNTTIISFCPPRNHGNLGANVLFIDGSARWLNLTDFEEELKRQSLSQYLTENLPK